MSTLKADTIQSTSGGAATLTKQAGVKMYTKTSGTYTALSSDSLNAASLVDNATGDVKINFTNSFSSSDYSTVVSTDAAGAKICTYTLEATTSITYRVHSDAGADADNNVCGTATGDLA